MFSWGRSKKKSECWQALSNHKTWRIRNHPININDTHILYATDCNVGENGIVLYDVNADTFDYNKYPPQMTPEYHSYCRHKDSIYMFESSGSVIRFSIRSRKFEYIANTKKRRRIGRYSACINVEDSDVIHIFGGLENEHHLMYSVQHNAYREGTDFGVKLENPSVCFNASTRQLLMFSGYANASYFVGTLLKPDVVEWEISKRLSVPNKLRDCGQVLHREHIVIFGGMAANTQYSNGVWLLSLREHDFGRVTALKNVQCPAKDKYFGVTVRGRVHLFGLWNNVKHHAVSTEVIDRHIRSPPAVPVTLHSAVSVAAAADYPVIPLHLEEEEEKVEDGRAAFEELQSQINERDQRILELEEENKALRELVAQIQRSRHRLDSICYKEWSADQIAAWISKLDNGLFAASYRVLAERLKGDGIEGADLKDINTHDDWKRYGIQRFGARKKVIQHISDLIDNDMYGDDGDADGQAATPQIEEQAANPMDDASIGNDGQEDEDVNAMPPGMFEEGQTAAILKKRRMTPYV